MLPSSSSSFFFFNDTATTEIYTLSLHDALPISAGAGRRRVEHDEVGPRLLQAETDAARIRSLDRGDPPEAARSEEHTSELQSLAYLVCRLLLEKKKNKTSATINRQPPTAGSSGL